MDLLDVMRTTPAIRTFTGAPIDDAAIYGLLDAARFAPSGGNAQGWHVIVVRDQATQHQLADLCQPTWNQYIAQRNAGERPFTVTHQTSVDLDAAANDHVDNPLFEGLDQAGAMLVVSVDLAAVAAMDKDLERIAVVPGASIYPFCQNIMLAASNEGFGGVLTTFLARKEAAAQALLGLPADHAVAAMIVLGHPVKRLTKLTRNPVEDFATVDHCTGTPLTAS